MAWRSPGGGSQREVGLRLVHFIIWEKYSWLCLCWGCGPFAVPPEGLALLGHKPRWAWQMTTFPGVSPSRSAPGHSLSSPRLSLSLSHSPEGIS